MNKISIYAQSFLLALVAIAVANNFCSERQEYSSNLYRQVPYPTYASSIEPYQTNQDDSRWRAQANAFLEAEINQHRGITKKDYETILEKTYTDMRLNAFGQRLLSVTSYLTFLVGLAAFAVSSRYLPLGDQNSKGNTLGSVIIGCAGFGLISLASGKLFFNAYNNKYLKQMIFNAQIMQLENSSAKLQPHKTENPSSYND